MCITLRRVIGNLFNYYGWLSGDVSIDIIYFSKKEIQDRGILNKKTKNGLFIMVDLNECNSLKNGDILFLRELYIIIAMIRL